MSESNILVLVQVRDIESLMLSTSKPSMKDFAFLSPIILGAVNCISLSTRFSFKINLEKSLLREKKIEFRLWG